jgi:putative ABC transport system permease protein
VKVNIKRTMMIVARQLSQRKLRSMLTVLGIIIGITAMISLIVLSNALETAITGQLDAFGPDEILVGARSSVGMGGGPTGTGFLTTRDVEVLEQIPQVLDVRPIVSQTLRVSYGRDERFMSIAGYPIDGELESFLNVNIAEGRFITEADGKAAMLGWRAAKQAFSREIFVGSRIRIANDTYRVIAVLEEEGSLSTDMSVIVPIDAIRDTLNDRTAVTAISVRVSPGADIDLMQERIKNTLRRYRGQDDIETTTPAEIQEQISGFLGVVDIVILSIAIISLIVAGLGITNSLFTSVLQRTREIGTMKAVGARNSQILSIFLLESVILALIGGVLGIVIGMLTGYAFITFFNIAGLFRLEFALSWILIAEAMIFSLALGIAAGVLPALRAAKLNPVDALRYE